MADRRLNPAPVDLESTSTADLTPQPLRGANIGCADGDLLSLSEWGSTDAFDVNWTTLNAEFLADAALEPPQIHRLVRLLTFERPLQRAAVTACALIVPTRGDSGTVHERVVHDRQEIRTHWGCSRTRST